MEGLLEAIINKMLIIRDWMNILFFVLSLQVSARLSRPWASTVYRSLINISLVSAVYLRSHI